MTVLQEHTACGKGYSSPLAMAVISVLSPLAMEAYTLKEKKQESIPKLLMKSTGEHCIYVMKQKSYTCLVQQVPRRG